MKRRLFTPLIALLSLTACGSSGDTIDQSGDKPRLPGTSETLLPPMSIAKPTGWAGEVPTVPQGFTITSIATDLKIPRQMLVLPNGDILIAEGSGGGAPKIRPKDVIAGMIKARGKSPVKGGDQITLLRDQDRDGKYELRAVFISDLNAPYGLALAAGKIYVANQDALLEFPYTEGQTEITSPGREVTKLPSELNHHWTKAMAASPDETKLYVGIGSNSNIMERGPEAEIDRAMVWEIDPQTGAHRPYATGLRNPTALAFNPETGVLWTAVNERDELGDHLVPDYITSVKDGGFYGWPYSYWGKHLDPRVRPQKPDLVARSITPDYAVGSHVAPLGLAFGNAGMFGTQFASGVFVGQHGSWNRHDLAGYKVVWIPFTAGKPAGKPIDFVTGFLTKDGKARGRPVGVAVDPIGNALLIADDLSNTIWRVTLAVPPAGAALPAAVSARDE